MDCGFLPWNLCSCRTACDWSGKLGQVVRPFPGLGGSETVSSSAASALHPAGSGHRLRQRCNFSSRSSAQDGACAFFQLPAANLLASIQVG